MKILADENIPYVREAFAGLGDVCTMSGRAMTADSVRDANLLLVRSVTKVNASLLEGSSVHFVATATIGEDHIDKAWLAGNGVSFSSAPGSNSGSVAQYIATALLELAAEHSLDLGKLRLGVIGVGNVGSKVRRVGEALGMKCVLNDPPLWRKTGDPSYRSLDEALQCDIVTIHVPLTKEGPDATRYLADDSFFARMKPGSILINSSRGAVVEGEALHRALDSGHLRAAVLDVWEGEPNIDRTLLEKVFIGTPHIAGYSFDGKVNGTRQIYVAACDFAGAAPSWNPAPLLPAPECPEVTVNPDEPDALLKAVRAVYDIRRDDAATRRLLTVPEGECGRLFDQLRKEYPRRREFFNTRAGLTCADAALEKKLAGLGYKVERVLS